MTDIQARLNFTDLQHAIRKWLKNRLVTDSFQEIDSRFQRLIEGAEDWEVFSSFSAVPRYTGKHDLELRGEESAEAHQLRPGWEPGYWKIDQLGRTLLVLGIAMRSKKEFLDKLEKMFQSSDVGEAVALYQSLPVLPHAEELRARAAEGIRSNMSSVFNAVALRNPYPAGYLADDAWNQLVLKALFIGSPLYLIQGIDRRANEDLANMLVDYAHERWSAGRSVSPELWRPVGPFIDKNYLEVIKKAISQPDKIQKQAAALALTSSGSAEAGELLEENRELMKSVEEEGISWDEIGKKVHEQSIRTT